MASASKSRNNRGKQKRQPASGRGKKNSAGNFKLNPRRAAQAGRRGGEATHESQDQRH